VVAYVNRSNNKTKAKYNSYEGECLIIVWVVSSFQQYLYGDPFTFIIDHQPLKFLMESYQLTRKLVRWAFILQKYDFDIIHKPGKVNQNENGLSQNPSSNEEYTTGAHWQGDVDLKTVLGWHAFAYLCNLLGCFGDVPQTNVDDGDPHDVDMEFQCNGALDIYEDAPIIAYLQVDEVLIRITPKERDRVVHRAKWFKWEGNSFLRMWAYGQVKVVFCPKQCESLARHVHEELGHFGVQWTYNLF
jgi:hypothetical protein